MNNDTTPLVIQSPFLFFFLFSFNLILSQLNIWRNILANLLALQKNKFVVILHTLNRIFKMWSIKEEKESFFGILMYFFNLAVPLAISNTRYLFTPLPLLPLPPPATRFTHSYTISEISRCRGKNNWSSIFTTMGMWIVIPPFCLSFFSYFLFLEPNILLSQTEWSAIQCLSRNIRVCKEMESSSRRYCHLQTSWIFIHHQETQIPHPPSVEEWFTMGGCCESLERTEIYPQRLIPPLPPSPQFPSTNRF